MALASISRNALKSALANSSKEVTGILDTMGGGVAGATFSVGAEATNVIIVSVQLTDAFGNDLSERAGVFIYISTDADGDTVNADDYTVAAGTDGVVVEAVADVLLFCVSEADGDIDISLTQTGAATSYLHLISPNGRLLATSSAITHAA